jgi:hypothetical protein
VRSRPPSVKPAARPDPPGPSAHHSRGVIVTVTSGSRPEGPGGSGVNGLTPGPLRLLGRRCRQARGLLRVDTRLPLPLFNPEMPLPDIRDTAAARTPVEENTKDWTRVPDMDTTRDALEVAARALEEMEQRRAWEADREAEDRAYQTTTRQAADQVRDGVDSYADVLE